MKNRSKHITGIIVARQGSSRLPEKALADINGKPVIGRIYERLKASPYINDIVIATSTLPPDDAIENYCNENRIKVFRGDPEDVLSRIYKAVEDIETDGIIEVGGDCPLVSTGLIEEGMSFVSENPDADIVSNALVSPYTYPDGFDFIYVRKSALAFIYHNATLTSERFQPFQYFVKHKEKFNVITFQAENDFNHWRWTLDYPEDLAFIKKIYSALLEKNPLFQFEDIKNLLLKQPEIVELNSKHALPREVNSAWYTGSYIGETHNDILHMLSKATIFEKNKEFQSARNEYAQIQKLIIELIQRAELRHTNG